MTFSLSRVARKGNFMVTSFFIVMGMTMVVGGVSVMLRQQMDSALTIKDISFTRLQTYYLAEMALNQMMFTANTAARVGDTLNTFPVTRSVGTKYDFDYTNSIWLTRPVSAGGKGVTGSSAKCRVTCTATAANTASFQVDATMVNPSVGTFTRTITFTATYSAAKSMWALTAYAVTP